MKGQVVALEQRRASRKRTDASPLVTDTISARPLGHLCNLSASGVLLIAQEQPLSEAVFQARLPLADGPHGARSIELGLQEQWQQPAASPGHTWVGYRIIAIAPADAQALVRWLQPA